MVAAVQDGGGKLMQARDAHNQANTAPSSRVLRTALIGGGRISEQHLRAIEDRNDVAVAAVCDLSPALAQFTADRFGVPEWFTDYREMLDAVDADVVHVLTPAATHVPIVQYCIERLLHVIVEKPIALTNDEFRALWRHATARKVRLIENQNYRFNRGIAQLEQLVRSGRLGAIREVDVELALNVRAGGRYADENLPHPSHQLPGGVIHEFISHLCSLLLHVLPHDQGDDVHVLRAAWANRGGGAQFKYDDLDAVVEAGGVRGRIRFSSYCWPDQFLVRVHGSSGTAAAELFQPSWQCAWQRQAGHHLTPLINSVAAAGAMVRAGVGNVWRKVCNQTAYEGLHRFIELTYESLLQDSTPPVSFDDMDATSRLIDALLPREDSA